MSKSIITFRVRSTGPELNFCVLLDDKIIHQLSPGVDFQSLTVEVNDDIEQEHLLELVMTGKNSSHTQIDENGNILTDRVIEISDVYLDGIELGYVFTQCTRYQHNFNGSSDPVDQKFYGTIGCNGTVKFSFKTPVYLWLLENM